MYLDHGVGEKGEFLTRVETGVRSCEGFVIGASEMGVRSCEGFVIGASEMLPGLGSVLCPAPTMFPLRSA